MADKRPADSYVLSLYTHTLTHCHHAPPSCTHSDRFIILGNHRDAWVFGGVDPNSGTAVLMELARALSQLRSIGRKIASQSLV